LVTIVYSNINICANGLIGCFTVEYNSIVFEKCSFLIHTVYAIKHFLENEQQ